MPTRLRFRNAHPSRSVFQWMMAAPGSLLGGWAGGCLVQLSNVSYRLRSLLCNEAKRRVMAVDKDKSKTDRIARITKKGGRIAARAAGGLAAPAAVYAAAASLGTASTGTAISALSGAVATKATLAWLGGGALAAGGLGVAGGAVVLGAVGVGGAYGAKKLYDRATRDQRTNAGRKGDQ